MRFFCFSNNKGLLFDRSICIWSQGKGMMNFISFKAWVLSSDRLQSGGILFIMYQQPNSKSNLHHLPIKQPCLIHIEDTSQLVAMIVNKLLDLFSFLLTVSGLNNAAFPWHLNSFLCATFTMWLRRKRIYTTCGERDRSSVWMEELVVERIRLPRLLEKWGSQWLTPKDLLYPHCLVSQWMWSW